MNRHRARVIARVIDSRYRPTSTVRTEATQRMVVALEHCTLIITSRVLSATT